MRKLLRSVVSTVVLAFAAYAFVKVPIGRRTGLGHLEAILKTKAVAEAAADAKQAALETGRQILPHDGLPKISSNDGAKPASSGAKGAP